MGLLDFFRGSTARQKQGEIEAILSGGVGRREPPRKGTRELLKAFSTMPWLHATTHRVATSVAAVEWEVLRPVRQSGQRSQVSRAKMRQISRSTDPAKRRKDLDTLRKQDQVEPVEEHPVLDLLTSGNPLLVSTALWATTSAQFDLVGESFWLKDRGNTVAGPVQALWPISPHNVADTPDPVDPNPLFKVGSGSNEKRIPAADVIWFRDPDPFNPYGRGSGIARSLADELDTDEFAAKHTKSFFYNNARPDLLISLEDGQENEMRALKKEMDNRHRGFLRAFRNLITNRKLDVQEIGQSFRDMRFVELRKFERDTIVQVYGIPPELIGILTNSNRATIEGAEFIFTKWVLVPRLEMYRAVLQRSLVDEFDDALVLDYVSPVTEDKEHNRQVVASTPWAFTVDEIRAMADHEPLPDGEGDVRMRPLALRPVEDEGQGDPPPQEEPEEDPPQLPDDPEAMIRILPDRTGKAFELEAEAEVVVDAVDVDLLLDSVLVAYQDTLEAFGTEVFEFAGIEDQEFDLSDPAVVAFLAALVAERLARINETTRNRLRAAIREGGRGGETVREIEERVEEVFADAKQRRSLPIAITESVVVANLGILIGSRQAGFEYKEWVTQGDDKVRSTHRAIDGHVIDLDGVFVSPNGATATQPGRFGVAAEDVNCRCAIAPRETFNGETSYLDTETKRVEYWKQFEANREPFEEIFRDRFAAGFARQERAALEIVRSTPERGERAAPNQGG